MGNQMQEAPLEYYGARYRDLDPEEASKRTGLQFSPGRGNFAFEVLGFALLAEWPEFSLNPVADESCPPILYGFKMQVLVMRYLLEGVATHAGGGFKAYREFPWGELYDANFQGRCIKRFAYSFGFKPDKFRKAAEALGGREVDFGDVSYELPFLGGVVIRLALWTPDEEFPPSSQILFSDNAQTAFSAEDLAIAGDVIIGALKESGN